MRIGLNFVLSVPGMAAATKPLHSDALFLAMW